MLVGRFFLLLSALGLKVSHASGGTSGCAVSALTPVCPDLNFNWHEDNTNTMHYTMDLVSVNWISSNLYEITIKVEGAEQIDLKYLWSLKVIGINGPESTHQLYGKNENTYLIDNPTDYTATFQVYGQAVEGDKCKVEMPSFQIQYEYLQGDAAQYSNSWTWGATSFDLMTGCGSDNNGNSNADFPLWYWNSGEAKCGGCGGTTSSTASSSSTVPPAFSSVTSSSGSSVPPASSTPIVPSSSSSVPPGSSSVTPSSGSSVPPASSTPGVPSSESSVPPASSTPSSGSVGPSSSGSSVPPASSTPVVPSSGSSVPPASSSVTPSSGSSVPPASSTPGIPSSGSSIPPASGSVTPSSSFVVPPSSSTSGAPSSGSSVPPASSTPSSGSVGPSSSGPSVPSASSIPGAPSSGSSVPPASSSVTPSSGSSVPPASSTPVVPSSGSSVPPASSTPGAPSSGSIAPSTSSCVTASSSSSLPPASSTPVPWSSSPVPFSSNSSSSTPTRSTLVPSSSGTSVPPASSTSVVPSSGSVVPSTSSSVITSSGPSVPRASSFVTPSSDSSVPLASSTPVVPSSVTVSGSSTSLPSGSDSSPISSATVTSSPSAPSAVPSGSSGPSLPVTIQGSASTSTSLVTSTEVVTKYTTYCPGPTTFTTNGVTYTVTEATTLTITDCPCTLTHTNTIVVPTTADTVAPGKSPQGSGNSPSATVVTVKTASGNSPQGNHKAPSPAVSTSLVITTEVVTEYTTYCPSPTTFSTNGVTYSVPKATTLIVTGPRTITRTNTVMVPTSAEENDATTKGPDGEQGYVPTVVTVTAGGNSPQDFNNSPSVAAPTTVTVTDVVSTLTTYCPGYTTFSTNGVSYTVTEPTTLTITDCPCTVTRTSVFAEHVIETVTAGPYFPISSGFSASNGTVVTQQYNQTKTLVEGARNDTTVTIFTTAPGAIYGSTSNVVKTIGQNNTVTPRSNQLKARAVTFTRSDEHLTVPNVKSFTANAANRLLASPFLLFLGLLMLW